MPILHVPLVFPLEGRSSSIAKDPKMVNGYVDAESKEKAHATKRPGIGTGTLYEAAAAQGVITYLGVARVVVNNKFYETTSASDAIDAAGALVDFA